jgi:acyl carrier protein
MRFQEFPDMSSITAAPKLAKVFVSALDLAPDTDVTTLAYGQHEHWDSIGHMALVAEIEDAYGVMLDTEDLIGLSDWQAAVDLLGRLGVSA